MRVLDDNPTTADTLGYTSTVEALFTIITDAPNRKMLPLTVGVFGGWGSGKTSLMRITERRLQEQGVKTVWFNAWKYDGKEVIWNALLQTIFYKMKIDAEAEGALGPEFRERVVRTAKALARYSAKIAVRLVPGGIVREEDVDAVLDLLSSSADDPLFEAVNGFESDFEDLSRRYAGDHGYIVVFIDDLDRCLPENAIEVMEALKLYLDSARCVFVVGAEPAVIEEAIRRRYGNNPFLAASDYLEKIVQIPIFVPRARTAKLLASCDIPGLTEDPEIDKLVRIATSRNPRRAKRFLNAFAIASEAVQPQTRADFRGLTKTLLCQVCFPTFYRQLVVNPGLLEELADDHMQGWEDAGIGALWSDFHLRQFLRETQDTSPNRNEVRRWLRMEAPR